jgi:hypothetical protein
VDPSVRAVLATGSAARGRCSADSDLDLTVITDAPDDLHRVESRTIDGVTVDIEWLSTAAARRVATPPRRDIKALRDSARIGQAFVAFDRAGLAPELCAAAATLRPEPAEMRAHIEGGYRTLIAVGSRFEDRPAAAWDALRGVYDSVAYVLLQLGALRFQKPKWVVQDLAAAGETAVAECLLDAYGARRPSSVRARRTAQLAESLIEQVARGADAPGYHETLALGFTEDHARFSYVCRTLADARSLIADGAVREGRYTAMVAARMAVAFAAGEEGVTEPGEGGLFPILDRIGDVALARAYADLCAVGGRSRPPGGSDLARCLRCLERCRRRYARTYADRAAETTSSEVA